MILAVNQGSLDQVDPASNRVLCSYDYKDMEGLTQVSVARYFVGGISARTPQAWFGGLGALITF